MTQIADKVYRNAKVYSIALDGKETHAEAVAIKDGKFVYVGDEAGHSRMDRRYHRNRRLPRKERPPRTCRRAHAPCTRCGILYGTCSFSSIVPNPQTDTPEGVVKQMQDILRDYVEAHPDYPVIRGMGWDRTWFSGALQGIVRPLTRLDVDAVVSDRPVVLLSFCGHNILFNTKALEAAGVTKDTDDQNGLIVKDADGTPTGYIKEPAAYFPLVDKIPNYDFTAKAHHDSIKKAFEVFNAKGYTLLCDCHLLEIPYDVLTEMAKNGEFTARVTGVFNVYDATRKEDMERAIAERTKYDVEGLFTIDTLKYFADGTPSMIEPFVETAGDLAGGREPLLWDEEHMMESMAEANKEGFNVHTHAMGSYAMRRVIDCYENAQKLYPNPNIRNIIAHCTFIAPEDIVRMGKSHIIASDQPGWFSATPTDEKGMVACWGEDVVRHTYPSKSLIDNGVVGAYGSDFVVNPACGLAGLQVAMTRRHVKMDLTYELYKDVPASMPEECVSLREALQAHTINAAYQVHLENVTGSIEVGKSAELIVLDSDIETTPAEHIEDIQVLETVFKGQTVFKKGS